MSASALSCPAPTSATPLRRHHPPRRLAYARVTAHPHLAPSSVYGDVGSSSARCRQFKCALNVEQVAEQLKQEVLASPVVHTDDTPVTLAMPQGSAGGSRQARVWVYLKGEGRHWYEFIRG